MKKAFEYLYMDLESFEELYNFLKKGYTFDHFVETQNNDYHGSFFFIDRSNDIFGYSDYVKLIEPSNKTKVKTLKIGFLKNQKYIKLTAPLNTSNLKDLIIEKYGTDAMRKIDPDSVRPDNDLLLSDIHKLLFKILNKPDYKGFKFTIDKDGTYSFENYMESIQFNNIEEFAEFCISVLKPKLNNVEELKKLL